MTALSAEMTFYIFFVPKYIIEYIGAISEGSYVVLRPTVSRAFTAKGYFRSLIKMKMFGGLKREFLPQKPGLILKYLP